MIETPEEREKEEINIVIREDKINHYIPYNI